MSPRGLIACGAIDIPEFGATLRPTKRDARLRAWPRGIDLDSRSTAFLEVMTGLAIIGVVSFLIFLVSRQALRSVSGTRTPYQPRWYELLLAAAFLLIVALVALRQFVPGSGEAWGEDGRASTFFVVMMIAGGGALAIFLISLFWRLARSDETETPARLAAKPAQAEAPPQPLAKHQTPSALRLVGLLGFAIAFLILNWAHVPPEQRHALMLSLIYPAGLILALVMLLDKASRAWDIKAPGTAMREWLYANMLLVLYVIAYLNLMGTTDPAAYGGMFWDMVHVAGFLLVVWILDRKASRLRFLLVHAWLIALPLLLLVWRSQMGIEASEDISWWDTVWPFFLLALVFFVVELIILIATDEGGETGIGTFKDVVFLVIYVILLISARPEAVA